MKKILVPTDFSKSAENALKVAAQIAKKNDGEIILLHLLEIPHQGSDAVNHGHDLPELMLFKNFAIKRLDDLMEHECLDGITVSEVIQFEMAFDGIMNVSKVNDVDLIVMGSHGASGFKEMFVGSNAEKVVRNSQIPVLIVKKEYEEFQINNLVFASDFADEVKSSFQKVIDFSNKFNAKLHLVTINTPNNFKSTLVANEIMQNFIANFLIKDYSINIFNDANIEKGVINFANHINAEAIGIGTHGRKGLAHFFNGSISEDLVNHANLPIVTFKI
jgi:nucleotide-binding universal stress UspA family protein